MSANEGRQHVITSWIFSWLLGNGAVVAHLVFNSEFYTTLLCINTAVFFLLGLACLPFIRED